MVVIVHLFARARDLAGTPTLRVELADDATVGDVRRGIADQCPALANLLDRSALALNNEFAKDHQTIMPGSEVALLPPVSGG